MFRADIYTTDKNVKKQKSSAFFKQDNETESN